MESKKEATVFQKHRALLFNKQIGKKQNLQSL